MVTSNHVHLLVLDNRGQNVIPDSIKLVAGRTGQEYNVRKNRKGAFWEDRYHATAVESNRYLRQCITYIDMNMVRAGVVEHPTQWAFCGYNEIQNPHNYRLPSMSITCPSNTSSFAYDIGKNNSNPWLKVRIWAFHALFYFKKQGRRIESGKLPPLRKSGPVSPQGTGYDNLFCCQTQVINDNL